MGNIILAVSIEIFVIITVTMFAKTARLFDYWIIHNATQHTFLVDFGRRSVCLQLTLG